jgi:WD40 repeat protein
LNITIEGVATSLAILSDGSIVCGDEDGIVTVHLSDGTLISIFDAFKYVNALITFPNGVIVSGSDDYTARVWFKNLT